jgi:chitin synthase
MQFVVFMELVGTLALPAAISFTLYLIILACIGQPAVLSLILLALILGLPAVLIVMTSRKLVYVGWMLIYLFSLPIWNFVLPTYAYWHFDDFTWGETRKVAGEGKDSHGDKEGEFDSSLITMKKWSEYERERRKREASERSSAVTSPYGHLSPLSRWSPYSKITPTSTNLSLEIDRSTLSTLIETSLSATARPASPTPPLPTASSPDREDYFQNAEDEQDADEEELEEGRNEYIERDSTLSHDQEDEEEDDYEEGEWRESLDYLPSQPTLDTRLPMALDSQEEGDEENWENSVMDSIEHKDKA